MSHTVVERLRSLCLLICWLAVPAAVSGNETELYSLHGVKRFYILVENLKPEAKQIGLTVSQVREDIELRLRSAGITILTESESLNPNATAGLSYLYANINNGLNVYAIEVSFKQPVLLERNQNIRCVGASTWSTGRIGSGAKSQLRQQIRDSLGTYIDAFIIDYLKSNSWK